MFNKVKDAINTRIINRLLDKKDIVRFSVNRNDRTGMLYKSWGLVFTDLIKGAYYEFGLYKGASFITSWKEYSKFRKWAVAQTKSDEFWRRQNIKDYINYRHDFYGFDTFEGMPANNEGSVTFHEKSFAGSFDEVDKQCRKAGMRYRLFKGLFSAIPKEEVRALEPAAIVNIDSDLYGSAWDALAIVRDKLQQGTILLMDDYNCFSSSDACGERRALREFCEKNPAYRFEPWMPYHFVGQAFLCHVEKS
ncbi:MAG: macrocin O-methyltransferase [Candidatus Omnitrophica bacterium]|nr:macrocin O-methyltransferase [Candidatus Omnitrophota bacterium]